MSTPGRYQPSFDTAIFRRSYCDSYPREQSSGFKCRSQFASLPGLTAADVFRGRHGLGYVRVSCADGNRDSHAGIVLHTTALIEFNAASGGNRMVNTADIILFIRGF